MTEGQRSLAAVLAGLIVWFGLAQVMPGLVALVIGLLAAGLAWVLTAALQRSEPPADPGE